MAAVSDVRGRPVIASERDDVAGDIEERWIAAARRDPRAFAPLYDRYATAIYRFCYRKVGDVEVANDLTAQVFVKAIERLDRYQPKPGATFRSWLFTIARNLVTDRWRRQRPTHPLDPVAHTLIDREPGPELLAIEADSLAHLRDVLDTLPEKQRAIVELRLAGFTTTEIMATLDMTEPAVKSAQHRAYRRLRDLMSPDQEPSR
ncbi:MAG: sigma-70 family RNA polymerase sigma factor [Thermomicrobiales bacterium]